MLLIEWDQKNIEQNVVQTSVFNEWYDLMLEAKNLGFTIEEIRAFIRLEGQSFPI